MSPEHLEPVLYAAATDQTHWSTGLVPVNRTLIDEVIRQGNDGDDFYERIFYLVDNGDKP